MPELPEVETSRQGIMPYIKGNMIKHIIVRNSRLRWPVPAEIQLTEKQTVQNVQRRAKYLLLQLEYGWIVIHLGMSGSLRILLTPTPAEKHDHIDLVFNDGVILRYTDPRRFGCWLWAPSLDQIPQLAHLGVEPLSEQFSPIYLYSIIQTRKVPIKTLIMDNHIVVGVGNIYACESLFMARLLPTRLANSLSQHDVTNLVDAIKQVLTKAIEQGGTTLKDFLQSDGKPGYFAQQLQVYGRAGKPCIICDSPIASKKIAQRNTFFCEHCQK